MCWPSELHCAFTSTPVQSSFRSLNQTVPKDDYKADPYKGLHDSPRKERGFDEGELPGKTPQPPPGHGPTKGNPVGVAHQTYVLEWWLSPVDFIPSDDAGQEKTCTCGLPARLHRAKGGGGELGKTHGFPKLAIKQRGMPPGAGPCDLIGQPVTRYH